MREGKARPDLAAPLEPEGAWSTTLDGFVGRGAISERFAIDGREPDYDPIWAADIDPLPIWIGSERTRRSRYMIRAVEEPDFSPDTVVLLCGETIRVGFLTGAALWIDPEHRGRGLGAELVLAQTHACGRSPTFGLGGIGFSAAGHATYAKAWRLARARHRATEAARDRLKEAG